MAAITLPGTGSGEAVPVHFATVPGYTPNTGSYPAGATSGNIYPSFALLSCLRDAYGSEVGMDYRAVYANSLAGETNAQLMQHTCDTEQVFINHGFYRNSGCVRVRERAGLERRTERDRLLLRLRTRVWQRHQ